MSENDAIEGYLRETNVIQKSRPLSLMRCVPFSLGELKVLDVYLSRINSHDPDHRTVTFTKAEYEELMGIEKTNLVTFKKYTRGMLGKVVDVPMPDGYLQFVLFTKAECKKDEYGVPVVTLTCTDEAKRLFFDIEQLGYLRYELRNILTLSSKYSYLLYLEIIRERYREEWSVSLPRLRDTIFDLKKNEYYKEFKRFNNQILKPAVDELNKKTDCCIEYDLIKRGRTVTDIKFRYTPREMDDQLTLTDLSPIPSAEDLEEDDPEEKWIKVYGSERLANLAEVCNYEWGREDMERIECILRRINIAPDPNTNSVEWGRVFFLREQYAILNSEAAHKAATGKRISNRLKYLVGMLERKAEVED